MLCAHWSVVLPSYGHASVRVRPCSISVAAEHAATIACDTKAAARVHLTCDSRANRTHDSRTNRTPDFGKDEKPSGSRTSAVPQEAPGQHAAIWCWEVAGKVCSAAATGGPDRVPLLLLQNGGGTSNGASTPDVRGNSGERSSFLTASSIILRLTFAEFWRHWASISKSLGTWLSCRRVFCTVSSGWAFGKGAMN